MRHTKELTDIVKRVQALKWHVTRKRDGIRVIHCPDGHRVEIHGSYSDVNAVRAVLRDLNNHGLTNAERQASEWKEQRRQALIAADKEAAAKALELAQKVAEKRAKEAAALRKAAGEPDERFLLTPQPEPSIHFVHVDPGLAEKLLTLNSNNRRIRRQDVTYWAGVMDRDEWTLNHAGIAINTDGELYDGQHRLHALIQTGKTLLLVIAVGMPVDAKTVTDTGRKRSSGDYFGWGGETDVNKLAAALRLLNLYDRANDDFRNWNTRVSNAELQATLDANPRMRDAIRAANRLARHPLGMINSAGAVGIYLLWREWRDDDDTGAHTIETFIDRVAEEHTRKVGEPAGALRRFLIRLRMSRGKRSNIEQLACLIKAWNNTVTGTPTSQLRWTNNEPLPRVIGRKQPHHHLPEAA